jgi:hypothetical protein
MSLLSENGDKCEQFDDAPHKWAANAANEQCKLG